MKRGVPAVTARFGTPGWIKYLAAEYGDLNPARHSGMLLAEIQKSFLDTGQKPAGMTNRNSDTHLCGKQSIMETHEVQNRR
jgi:hypothetical protein